jgi:protein SCO1/2
VAIFRNQSPGWTIAFLDMIRTFLRTRCFRNSWLRPGRGTNARGQALCRCLYLVATSFALAAHPGRCRAAELVAAPAETREFTVKGVVKKVEPENSRVIIAHEAIPGFMDAMTMPFRVKAPEILAAVQAGDSVSFRLSVTAEQSWIDNVVKISALSNSSATATNREPTEAAVSTVASRPRHPLLDYAFTNELGQPVRLGEFRGQVLAMTFFFSRCPIPDYCPRLMKNFEEASLKLRSMPGAPTNYHFLSVTFDPEFDTPARLKTYAEGYGYDPSHWSFLTGPAEKMAELARLSDVKYQRDGAFFNHDLRTLIIDGSGRLRMKFPVGGNLSGAIVEEILKAAAATNQPVHAE